MRVFRYEIQETDANQKIQDFLKEKGFSSKSLIVLKKQENSVLINDTPVFMTHMLQKGELLTISLIEENSSEHIPPVNLPLSIVYEDEDLMVVNKPADMPIHPSLNNYENSLGNAVAWYFAEKNEPFVFRCVNRLDRDTSGLTVIAKNMVSAGILSAMIAQKEACGFHREYLAIVQGCPTPSEGTIDAPIARKGDSIIERVIDWEKGDRAITHYHVLAEKNGLSLVSLILETGRTHQIRVHMKHLGYPLIGDYLYNPDMQYISRQALHAYRLKFTHPITGEPMEFVAPLPSDMQFPEAPTI